MKFSDVPEGRQVHLAGETGGAVWRYVGLNEAQHIGNGVRRHFGPELEVEALVVSVELWATDTCSGCGTVCRVRTIEARGKYATGAPICIPCAVAG